MKIGLAVLKTESEQETANLLLKRYTLQIENLKRGKKQGIEESSSDEENSHDQTNVDLDDWNFRESILKCLYAKDIKYPASTYAQIT